MSQLQLLLQLGVATYVSGYYLAPTRPLQVPRDDFQEAPPPELDILEIIPSEGDHLLDTGRLNYPADYFDLDQVPSYVDYVEDPMEYSQYQQDYPLYGEIGGGDLRVLSKENDSQDFEPDHESPKTPKKPQAITSVRPPPEPVSRMTQERRGMLEVPILRPEEARDPKFLFRGRKKRSIPTSAKKD